MLALILAASASAGCTTYERDPLPSIEALSRSPEPDVERLESLSAQLRHPALPPIALVVSDGLSPEEAAVLAVLSNPDLAAARDQRGEAAAQLIAAGLLPNPTFGAEVDHPHGLGASGTVNASNLTLGFDLTPILSRSARVAAASAGLKSVDRSVAWQEWQVAGAAKLQTIRLGWLSHRIGLVSEEMDHQSQTVDLLERAMNQGDAILSDVAVHRAALEGLRQQRNDLATNALETRRMLDRLLGVPPESEIPVSVSTPPSSWPALPEVSTLITTALTKRLDLESLRFGYDSQEATVRQAIWNRFPSITVGVSRQRNETALKFLGGFVQLGLPVFDRNQGAIALELATRTRLRDEYVARAAQVRSDITTLVASDELHARQIDEADRGIEELARIESAELAAVTRGDLDRLSYQVARGALADLRFRRAALEQARAEGRAALETVSGALFAWDTPRKP